VGVLGHASTVLACTSTAVGIHNHTCCVWLEFKLKYQWRPNNMHVVLAAESLVG
jgi:hypothetical protein